MVSAAYDEAADAANNIRDTASFMLTILSDRELRQALLRARTGPILKMSRLVERTCRFRDFPGTAPPAVLNAAFVIMALSIGEHEACSQDEGVPILPSGYGQ